MGRLDGKVAIINGAGPGFGMEVALGFAREGAKVIAVDVTESNARGTMEAIHAIGGEAIYAVADASELDQVQAAVKKGVEAFGPINILYNNAGLQGKKYYANILDAVPSDCYRSIDVNYKGHWHYMHTVAPIMHDIGGGSIINIASVAGVKGGNTIYGGTKAGVIGCTRATETDLGQYNIRLNSVSPFFTKTPLKIRSEEESAQEALNIIGFAKDSPMKKICSIHSIVDAIVFLASDESRGIAAFDFRVDTGICKKAQPFIAEREFLAANPY